MAGKPLDQMTKAQLLSHLDGKLDKAGLLHVAKKVEEAGGDVNALALLGDRPNAQPMDRALAGGPADPVYVPPTAKEVRETKHQRHEAIRARRTSGRRTP